MRSLIAWRSALRIARRDAWSHKGRSALIIAMVAIPVLGLVGADVLARTMQLSPNERVTREIGQADAAILLLGGKVDQTVDPLYGGVSFAGQPATQDGRSFAVGSPRYTALSRRALGLLGVTSSSVVDQFVGEVGANDLRVVTTITQLALNQPLTRGIVSLQSGRMPQSASEVAVTSPLAGRLGLHVGSRLTAGSQPRTVTAVVHDPIDLRAQTLYVLPGAMNLPRQANYYGNSTAIELLKTSRPVTWPEVEALNAIGVGVVSRQVIENPPPGVASYFSQSLLTTRDAVGVETVAVGMAILEVGLLAGAAFAVGARRQRHDLAVVAAAGAGPADVRRVVLAGGVVLGLAGTVIGTALGIALYPVALPYVEHWTHHLPGHFDLRPLEILGVMLLGLVIGVLSAVLPARSAGRDDVVLALSGRRGVVRSARRIPIVGIAMIVIGIVIAYRATLDFHFRVILAGAVVSELGFVLCAPALVGLVSRLGRYVGLAPRLALRDAARHRGRSGPAVAAIMAAVSGAMAVSTYFVTSAHNDKLAYTPFGRIGQATLYLNHQRSAAALAEIDATMRRDLAATRIVDVPTATCVQVRSRCAQLFIEGSFGSYQGVAVGGPDLLRVLIQRTDPAAERAVLRGRVVRFADLRRGPVTGRLAYPGNTGDVTVAGAGLPYVVDIGDRGVATSALISPATAARLHARTSLQMQLAVTPATPTQRQIDRADAQIPSDSTIGFETGYHSRYSTGLVILAIAAAIVMLGATAVAVGLSMAESKPDLVTLSAVGSRPMTRRLLVASQAGTVALLGAAQGLVAGLIPAWAVLHALRRPNFTLPWQTMLLIVVAIPLLSMLGTALFAGNRLILDRRTT